MLELFEYLITQFAADRELHPETGQDSTGAVNCVVPEGWDYLRELRAMQEELKK